MSRTMPNSAFTAQERADILEQYGRFLTQKQAAELTSSSERTIGRQVEHGKLTVYRVGASRALRLKTTEVMSLMEQIS